MKANKNELKLVKEPTMFPEEMLEKVIFPFIPQIIARDITVYFCKRKQFDFEITADWNKY